MTSLHHQKEEKAKKESPDLKGTFISVMMLGLFILASWFGVYALFVMR
ncbi:cytochrome c oxidase subunit 2A [Virgibacillus salinus]|uniref:Cytochrome c oxidase subunit IIa family protein n=1 Tax=Virgibacillus salinus TaxID=553311 RepID=A0A1H1BUE5_9BACI|nr:cytochrome c oxidase subunit 2A [Virgibacillus salinus]SDQ55529.1 Cytochrome c oxidase subunit IIa family protein [Virgibacillus salinus]